MRGVLGWALTLVCCCGLLAEDKKDATIDAKKLVGKWEPKDRKEGRSAVMEFAKDGKVTATVSPDGKEMIYNGTYKVDGNKLTMTLKLSGNEVTQTHTVTKLTGTELRLKADTGEEETLVRVEAKK
jgi:uncharacterized protein (TIGR03066 family)